MGAQASLTPDRLAVVPGGEVSAQITVTNTGTVVDSFSLDVLGPAAQWSSCEPAVVSTFPGQAATAAVTFRPPDATVAAGPLGFGVHVRSQEDPAGSVVEEGVLDIEAVSLLTAEMSPRTGRARGRRRSKHQVAVDNRGNAPAFVQVAGFDDQDAVDVTVDPAQLEVAAGAAAFVKVRARAVHRFWRGPSQTKPFAVQLDAPGNAPIRMPGTLLHDAAVPAWLPKAVAVVAAACAALALLWFGLFRQAVKDTATSAAQVAASKAASAALSSAGVTPGSGSGGGAGSPSTTPSAMPTPTLTPTIKPSKPPVTKPSSPPLPKPVAFSRQLDMGQPNLVADKKKRFTITDLVLQNPAGDHGVISVVRSGQPLITVRLEYFPVYDVHFVTPIMVPSGSSVSLHVTCANTGGKPCTPSALVSGMVETVGL
jgi:type II secretory pathway pseudopilin PulG